MKPRAQDLASAKKSLASSGGIARAKALSPEERVKIARMGGRAGGRGRRKDDLLPDDLREKIWNLIKSEEATTLWWMTKEARRPQTRSMAKRTLRHFSQYSSLRSYKMAHEFIACLS